MPSLQKLEPHHFLTAVFLLFLLAIGSVTFVPNITAAATAQQPDGMSFTLLWALPLFAIITVVLFCSYRGICACRAKD